MKNLSFSRFTLWLLLFLLIFAGCRNSAPVISHDQGNDTISVVYGNDLTVKLAFADDRDELKLARVTLDNVQLYSGTDNSYPLEIRSAAMRAGDYSLKMYTEDQDGMVAEKELLIRILPVNPVAGQLTVNNVRATSAMMAFKLISDGGEEITETGLLWSEKGEPGINDNKIVITESGKESYIVDGFPRNKDLFARVFVANNNGVTLTNTVQFKTMDGIPQVKTGNISALRSKSVSVAGTLKSDGGADLTMYGVVCSTNRAPDTGDNVAVAKDKSSFIVKIEDLTPFTKYYYRTFASNRFTTVYGDEGMFVTTGPPSVLTGETGRITVDAITMSIDITADGGHPVTEAGVVYSLLKNPTLDTNKSIFGKGTGLIKGVVGNLEPGGSYHLRAYAVNSEGVSYGEEIVLFTKLGIPAVNTTGVSEVDVSSARISGKIEDDGGLDVIERGVVWDTIVNPTRANNFAVAKGDNGEFSINIDGLKTGERYYARAYARNERGYVYADPVNFVPLISMDMVRIGGETFYMGSENGGEQSMPVHPVNISPFRISKYEVTNVEFARFLNAHLDRIIFEGEGDIVTIDGKPVYYLKVYGDDYNKSGFRVHIAFTDGKFSVKPECERFPAILVSWEGARMFCEWAGGRLPTEAEWEFAARGGKDNTTYSGGENIDLLGWYYRNSRNADCELTGDSRGLFKTGRKRPNQFGLYDMTGNAAEWCNDYFAGDYYKNSPETDPTGPEKGIYRVIRGGSWTDREELCTVYYRLKSFDVTRGYDNISFRLVRPIR